MDTIEKERLVEIKGGTTNPLTSAFLNAFTNIVKVLFDAGHSVGGAFRRIAEDSLCPLE